MLRIIKFNYVIRNDLHIYWCRKGHSNNELIAMMSVLDHWWVAVAEARV